MNCDFIFETAACSAATSEETESLGAGTMPAKTRRNDRKDARPRYSAPALEKGLDIIELLSDARQPLSMAQLLEHQNTGKENRHGKNFFVVLISTLGRFDRANKKNLSYTL